MTTNLLNLPDGETYGITLDGLKKEIITGKGNTNIFGGIFCHCSIE